MAQWSRQLSQTGKPTCWTEQAPCADLVHARVSVRFQELIFRDIHIKGTLIGGQEVSQQMLNDAERYNIKVETNVFHGLNEVPKMVDLAHSGKMSGKAVCVVNQAEFEKEKAGH
jgi:alcohol dehydrogenase, propanol-preferring